jgi:hypothetical protein
LIDIQFLIELGVGCSTAYLIYKETLKHLTARVNARNKQAALKAQDAQNPLQKYGSFLEIATQAADLLDKQAQTIAENCKKAGKNPMEDTGYNTVVKQCQEALKWKTRLESPLGQIADTFTFPMAKSLAGETIKTLARTMKGVSL